MSKNTIQLVTPIGSNTSYLEIHAGKHHFCVGADKFGNIEVFPPNKVPKQFASDLRLNPEVYKVSPERDSAGETTKTPPKQINNAQAFKLLESIDKAIRNPPNGATKIVSGLVSHSDALREDRKIIQDIYKAGVTPNTPQKNGVSEKQINQAFGMLLAGAKYFGACNKQNDQAQDLFKTDVRNNTQNNCTLSADYINQELINSQRAVNQQPIHTNNKHH